MVTQQHLLVAASLTAALLLIYYRRRKSLSLPSSQPSDTQRTVVASFTAASDGEAIGKLLCRELPRDFPSKAFAKKTLGRGQVLVDGRTIEGDSTIVTRGQRIEYILAKRPKQHIASTMPPPSLKLEWAYTDDHFAVCVKPQGIAVQGGDKSCTLLRHAVGWALPPPNNRPDALAVARAVHRIDKATGGLLVFGRTNSACTALAQAFAEGAGSHSIKPVRKVYLAVVVGKLVGEGRIDAPIQGKRALTIWRSLSCVRSAKSGWVTTLRLEPETGRYHQLRRHLALELACPILGDKQYLSGEARAAELGENRMHLWAYEITLPHPMTGEDVHVSCKEEPELFEETRRKEAAEAEEMEEAAWAEAAEAGVARRQRAAERAKAILSKAPAGQKEEENGAG